MSFDEWPELPEITVPEPPAARRSWDNETYEDRYVRQHHDLVRAASRLASELGYRGTQVAQIVAAARVSKRVFYEHFATKEECFGELRRRVEVAYVRRYITTVESLMSGPAHTVVCAVLHDEVAAISSNPGLSRALYEVATEQPRPWEPEVPPTLDLVSHFHGVLARKLGSPLDDAQLAVTTIVQRQGYISLLPQLVGGAIDIELVAALWCRAFALDDARSSGAQRRRQG